MRNILHIFGKFFAGKFGIIVFSGNKEESKKTSKGNRFAD